MLDSSLESEQGFQKVADFFTSVPAKLLLWASLAALIYHLVAGVRHLLMDLGLGESLEGGRRGERQTLSPGDPPMCLHAWKLAFRHPLSGERVRHVAPVPSWAGSVAADLEREEAAV